MKTKRIVTRKRLSEKARPKVVRRRLVTEGRSPAEMATRDRRKKVPAVRREVSTGEFLKSYLKENLEELRKKGVDTNRILMTEKVMLNAIKRGRQRSGMGADPLSKLLTEAASGHATSTTNIAGWAKLAFPLIRRIMPTTFIPEIIGNVTLDAPEAIISTMRYRYANTKAGVTAGAEALAPLHVQDIARAFSGNENVAAPGGEAVATLEGTPGNALKMDIVKKPIQVKSRKLSFTYPLELSYFTNSYYQEDPGELLAEAVTTHILTEIEQQILTRLRQLPPTPTAANTFSQPSITGQAVTVSDEFAALANLIYRQLDAIRKRTRLETGDDWIVVSDWVVTMLRSASASAFARTTDAQLERPTNNRLVGTLNGHVKIFMDQYANKSTPVLVGVKGSDHHAAAIMATFLPVEPIMDAVDPSSVQRVVSFMTMYDVVTFTNTATDLGNSADYLGLVGIDGTTLTFL